MSRKFAIAHLSLTGALVVMLGVTMFLAACEAVYRLDGSRGVTLGVVVPETDEAGVPMLPNLVGEAVTGFLALTLGGGAVWATRRRRAGRAARQAPAAGESYAVPAPNGPAPDEHNPA